jgi:hypothetical protein
VQCSRTSTVAPAAQKWLPEHLCEVGGRKNANHGPRKGLRRFLTRPKAAPGLFSLNIYESAYYSRMDSEEVIGLLLFGFLVALFAVTVVAL